MRRNGRYILAPVLFATVCGIALQGRRGPEENRTSIPRAGTVQEHSGTAAVPAVEVPPPSIVSAIRRRHVFGTAVDASGRGVAARVYLIDPGDCSRRGGEAAVSTQPVTIAGADGSFEFGDVPSAGPYTIAAFGDEGIAAWTPPLTVEGELGPVVLRLTAGARIVGPVLSEWGAVGGAEIEVAVHLPFLRLERELPDTRRFAVADAAGRYAVDGIPAGSAVEILVRAAGYRPAHPEALHVPIAATVQVDHWMERAEVVSGRVVDPQGRPVEGARVSLGQAGGHAAGDESVTGEDGGFVLDEIDEAAPAVMTVTRDGYQPSMSRGVPVDGVVVELVPMRVVRGRAPGARYVSYSHAGRTVRRAVGRDGSYEISVPDVAGIELREEP